MSSPTSPGAIGRRRSTDKAAAILEGAMQEFLQHGFAGASMDRVAAGAGVSKATVYGHYTDKQTLFHALTRALVQRRIRTLFAGLEAPSPAAENPQPRLLALATRILAVKEEQPELLRFLRLVIGESGRFPDLARQFAQEVQRQMLDRLSQQFAPHPWAELKARLFIGTLIHSVLFHDVLHGDDNQPLDRAALAKDLVALLSAADCPGPAPPAR